jgi:16S rRNA (guanine527-N7)-methyltransferase
VSASFHQVLVDRAGRAGLSIPASELDLHAAYFDLLLRWNQRINLTSLPLRDDLPASIDRLFIEPLRASALVPQPLSQWFDLGSGGGSPAVPMRAVLQSGRLHMVESRTRKASFLREVVRILQLRDTEVIEARIESAAVTVPADLVTMRAVRLDAEMERAIARMLRPAGTVLRFAAPDAPGFQSATFARGPAEPIGASTVVQIFTRTA